LVATAGQTLAALLKAAAAQTKCAKLQHQHAEHQGYGRERQGKERRTVGELPISHHSRLSAVMANKHNENQTINKQFKYLAHES
jgi:hypothetical protein